METITVFPRFCIIDVWTHDPTSNDDRDLRGKALCVSWFGCTFEFQVARPA